MAIALLLAERLAEGAGIDRDLTGAILAGWLVLAALAVSQIVLLIAMDCVNQELASLSRQIAATSPPR